ncbi:hypothetical protein RCS94_08480 [Orbaceae bacterium ac157xtp]
MLIVSNSYGALSATSANTIKGSAPTFTGQSGANKLGFKVGSTLYSEGEGNIAGGTVKIFDKDLKLNEFEVQSLTMNDFTVVNDYYDADGDAEHPTTPFTVGSVSYKWYESNGDEITNYTKMVGCSGLRHPLTLKISLPAQAHSMYGNPRSSSSVPLTKEYQISTTSGICFARPRSLNWESTYGISGSPTYGGGYNPAQFVSGYGFKADLATKFPTTGFPGAEFTLEMTSNASDWTFTHNGGSAVTVDTNGKVTLNSKPSGPVTIKAKLNGTSKVHKYTFDPRSIWLVPKVNSANSGGGYPYSYTYAKAKAVCGGESKIPSRAQLTNSPQNNAPQGWSENYNYYARAIGGGVFSEWGDTTVSYYPRSSWVGYWYWTRDAHSSNRQFFVLVTYGRIGRMDISRSFYVACLE